MASDIEAMAAELMSLVGQTAEAAGSKTDESAVATGNSFDATRN
jgi:hypothetical protein